MNLNDAKYLGDGLYMVWEGSALRLFSYNGIEVLNEVSLEPDVLAALLVALNKIFPEYPFDWA